ncbi:MAG: flagellar protein FlgN [Alicyclobacillus sp.]|nr:flagellar protein FlgN [Alicyclobacillus sp.]
MAKPLVPNQHDSEPNLVAQLEHLLTKLLSAYQRLLSLSTQQKEALVHGHTALLARIVRDMQSMTDAIQQTEQERTRVIQQLAELWGIPVDEITLNSLASFVGEAANQRMQATGSALRDTIQQLQRQNSENERLTQQSLRYMEKLFELLAKHAGTQSYGPKTGHVSNTGHVALNLQA